MSADRAAEVAVSALKSEGVANATNIVKGDYYTDCVLLIQLTARPESLARNAIESWWPSETKTGVHPCEWVQRYSEGRLQYADPPADDPYGNYWFGSRHLGAIMLRGFSYAGAESLYLLVSYVSVVLLALASLRRDRRAGLVLLPVCICLLFGFALHDQGHGLAHAPGIYVGFLLLALGIFLRSRLESFDKRIGAVAFLAVIVTYFDILDGAILLALSLTLVINHFVFARRVTWSQSLLQSLSICACFLVCYALVTALHLGLLEIIHDRVWQNYFDGLSVRIGDDLSSVQKVGLRSLVGVLWTERSRFVLGGSTVANLFFLGAAGGWAISAAWTGIMFRRQKDRGALTDLAVLAVAGAGVFAWFALFQNHSYIHAWFMARFLALPAAYGYAAVLVVTMANRQQRG